MPEPTRQGDNNKAPSQSTKHQAKAPSTGIKHQAQRAKHKARKAEMKGPETQKPAVRLLPFYFWLDYDAMLNPSRLANSGTDESIPDSYGTRCR